VLFSVSVSLAARAIVELGFCMSAAEAAETPAISKPAASATDRCFLMAIS
jgi:hypothetical protein